MQLIINENRTDFSVSFGSHFSFVLEKVFPSMVDYLTDKHSNEYRTLTLDTLANCAVQMEGTFPYTNIVLETSILWIQSNEIQLIIPAVDCIRVMLINAQQTLFPLYLNIFNEVFHLAERFQNDKEIIEVVSCTLCRMAVINCQELPIEKVIYSFININKLQ